MAAPVDPLVRRLRDERFDRAVRLALALGVACLCGLAAVRTLFERNLAALLQASEDCPEVRRLRPPRTVAAPGAALELR